MMTKEELNAKVKEYRQLSSMKAELDASLEAVRKDLLNYLQSNNKTCEIGDDYKLSYYTRKQARFDADKLKDLLADEIGDYQKVSESIVVKVS